MSDFNTILAEVCHEQLFTTMDEVSVAIMEETNRRCSELGLPETISEIKPGSTDENGVTHFTVIGMRGDKPLTGILSFAESRAV